MSGTAKWVNTAKNWIYLEHGQKIEAEILPVRSSRQPNAFKHSRNAKENMNMGPSSLQQAAIDLGNPDGILDFLRHDAEYRLKLVALIKRKPSANPSDLMVELFGKVPEGFGARGPYSHVYNSMYGRLGVERGKQGIPSAIHLAKRSHAAPEPNGSDGGSQV